MLFDRFEAQGLAHYSYAVGCPAAGRIAIVDPERNIERYLAYADAHGVRITHVLETHIHADYASGAHALAAATGAEVWASAYDEGETYTVSFPHRDVRDGNELAIGPVTIRAIHTPGHTPEHMSYLVSDHGTPQSMLTGDFLFVGSLGRPDLLGDEQKRALAHRLYASVKKLDEYPDHLEIHPAHGAGSLCGAGLSGRPSSTLGFERATNPYLDPELGEEEFVETILGNVPPFPPYYLRMKQLNADGAIAPALALRPVRELVEDPVVVDLRDRLAFAGGHVPGSLNIEGNDSLVVWASWFVPEDRPVVFVADGAGQANEAARVLTRVGLDNSVGWLEGGVRAWQERGGPVAQTTWAQPDMPAGDLSVIDVRSRSEYDAGHIPGAENIFLGELPETLDGTVVFVCRTGDRSTLAASVMESRGGAAYSLAGGMTAWTALGKEIEK